MPSLVSTLDGFRYQFSGLRIWRIEKQSHSCTIGITDAPFINSLPYRYARMWQTTPPLAIACTEIYVSVQLSRHADAGACSLVMRLNKQGKGVFAQQVIATAGRLPGRHRIRLTTGNPLIDQSEPGDYYELFYCITAIVRPHYALLEQRGIIYMEITDCKLVLKARAPVTLSPSSPVPVNSTFLTQWAYESIKSDVFLAPWALTANKVSLIQLSSNALHRNFGKNSVWIRSVCTGHALEADSSVASNTISAKNSPRTIPSQLWHLEFIVNEYTHPYQFIIIRNAATGKLLTMQRRDDTMTSDNPLEMSGDTTVHLDSENSRRPSWAMHQGPESHADTLFNQKWLILVYGKVYLLYMISSAAENLALEVSLQDRRAGAVALRRLAFERRQAWIIQIPPSAREKFILFLYAAEFQSLSSSLGRWAGGGKLRCGRPVVASVLGNEDVTRCIAKFLPTCAEMLE